MNKKIKVEDEDIIEALKILHIRQASLEEKQTEINEYREKTILLKESLWDEIYKKYQLLSGKRARCVKIDGEWYILDLIEKQELIEEQELLS